jgi:hypothetical protein
MWENSDMAYNMQNQPFDRCLHVDDRRSNGMKNETQSVDNDAQPRRIAAG